MLSTFRRRVINWTLDLCQWRTHITRIKTDSLGPNMQNNNKNTLTHTHRFILICASVFGVCVRERESEYVFLFVMSNNKQTIKVIRVGTASNKNNINNKMNEKRWNNQKKKSGREQISNQFNSLWWSSIDVYSHV